jgi:hypothetical protein
MATRLGHLNTVKNKNKKSKLEKDEYVCIWIKDQTGPKPLLLSELELSNAISRGKKNPEDVVPRSFISKLID